MVPLRSFFSAQGVSQHSPLYDDEPFPDAKDEDRVLLYAALEADNPREALLQLAESGVGCAMGALGMSYREGMFGFEMDEKKARTWLERGVKNEDACSMYLLGELRYDENTKSGAQEARLLWKRAAHRGHLRACYKYGVFLYAGLGGATNNVEARRLLEKASKGGFKHAWIHYSRLLATGLGGPIDEEMSRYWADKFLTEAKEVFAEIDADFRAAARMKALTSP